MHVGCNEMSEIQTSYLSAKILSKSRRLYEKDIGASCLI